MRTRFLKAPTTRKPRVLRKNPVAESRQVSGLRELHVVKSLCSFSIADCFRIYSHAQNAYGTRICLIALCAIFLTCCAALGLAQDNASRQRDTILEISADKLYKRPGLDSQELQAMQLLTGDRNRPHNVAQQTHFSQFAVPTPKRFRRATRLMSVEFRKALLGRAAEYENEARQAMDDDRFADAYCRLLDAVSCNDNAPLASAVLKSQLDALSNQQLATRNLPAIPTLNWSPNSYTRVTTQNFVLQSQGPRAQTVDLGVVCEEVLCVWRQFFFEYWADADVRAKLSRGEDCGPRLQSPIQVVIFRSRDDYVRALSRFENRVSVSTGYYSPQSRTAFFFWDDPFPLTTLVHELTHAFFHLAGAESSTIDTEASPNLWAMEGIALYLESATAYTSKFHRHYVVGGWDSPRLQAARYRALVDDFWVPVPLLFGLNGEDWRGRDDLPQIYTQAAGLTHWLMDSDEETRQQFIPLLYRAYGQQTAMPWESVTGVEEEMRRKYHDFLVPSLNELQYRFARPPRQSIVLPDMADIDDGLLVNWHQDGRNLAWMHLSGSSITDRLFVDASPAWQTTRLNVERTSVTDQSLPAIATMSQLSELDLSQCKVGDAGIAALRGHPSLTTLWLTGTQVTEKSLDVLVTCKRLAFLELTGTNVDAQSVATFRQKRRDVEVSWR